MPESQDGRRMWRLAWLGGLVLGLHTLTSYLEENLFKKLQFR
jgi:hypothetical protein